MLEYKLPRFTWPWLIRGTCNKLKAHNSLWKIIYALFCVVTYDITSRIFATSPWVVTNGRDMTEKYGYDFVAPIKTIAAALEEISVYCLWFPGSQLTFHIKYNYVHDVALFAFLSTTAICHVAWCAQHRVDCARRRNPGVKHPAHTRTTCHAVVTSRLVALAAAVVVATRRRRRFVIKISSHQAATCLPTLTSSTPASIYLFTTHFPVFPSL